MRLRPQGLSQPRHAPGPTRIPGPKPGDPPPGRTHGSHQALRPEGPDGPRPATRRPKTVRGRPPGRTRSCQVTRNGAVSNRELVVLGTASQAPTRSRNHNGYLLRWDADGLLFDPGEGTQRQMLFAGVTATQVTRICITHFHGDHCLGLPGVLQRMSLDRVPHAVEACYPAESREIFARLRRAALFRDVLNLRERPVAGDGPVAEASLYRLEARRLSHSVPTVGYRLAEPDGRRIRPDRLAAWGISGPDVGPLQRQGRLAA